MKVEIADDCLDGIVVSYLIDTREILREVIQEWGDHEGILEGDEQQLLEACDLLIKYISPIYQSKRDKRQNAKTLAQEKAVMPNVQTPKDGMAKPVEDEGAGWP